MDEISALVAHAAAVDAATRSRLSQQLRTAPEMAGVILETCHRVEFYGSTLPPDLRDPVPAGARLLRGEAAARHLVRVAVGLESSIVAEDQVLHQLRRAIQLARARFPLPPGLDHLADSALRAGRMARSWLPHRRPTLADVALTEIDASFAPDERPVLVVGAGSMGRAAAMALKRMGRQLLITSRTRERAVLLAAEVGARSVPFDPGPLVSSRISGVVVALAGPWKASETTQAALCASRAWVVDLSAPPSLPAWLVTQLSAGSGARMRTVDDLAQNTESAERHALSRRLLERLNELVDRTLAEHDDWSRGTERRTAAAALSRRAAAVQSAELSRLWGRLQLDDEQRAEVEKMASHLTRNLLRDPLERLAEDNDGRQSAAARELFRL
jgi:glutamyl-tRNA reductase